MLLSSVSTTERSLHEASVINSTHRVARGNSPFEMGKSNEGLCTYRPCNNSSRSRPKRTRQSDCILSLYSLLKPIRLRSDGHSAAKTITVAGPSSALLGEQAGNLKRGSFL
jgi:hypothetical protein